MKRATLIFLATLGAGVALGPGPAGAGLDDDTLVTSHPRQGGGYVLEVTGAGGPGSKAPISSTIILSTNTAQIVVRDEGPGITDDSPMCTQQSPTEVHCKAQGYRGVVVDTGDGADSVSAQIETAVGLQPTFVVRLGPGRDAITADAACAAARSKGAPCVGGPVVSAILGPGRDKATVAGRVSVRAGGGSDNLSGGPDNQRLLGGAAPDNISGGAGDHDHCDGQGGDDSGGDGCETIVSL